LEVVVTRLNPRHESPDGANGHGENLGAFDLTLATVQERFKVGQGLSVQ
jgi:hypothetical protein